jgi:galactokinase
MNTYYMKKIKVSAPGRICLFGEHQDYLQLPVITAAIDLRVELTATPRNDQVFHIDLPDISKKEILNFSNDQEFLYTQKRDYFKSIYNVLFRKGILWQHGWDCEVKGRIPINSGTSSSSALNNVWCRFLLEVGENVKPEWKLPEQVGHFSYLAEVVEFDEPGGKMDQLSTAIGGVLHINFSDNERITKLPAKLRTFILGDSQQPKDTMKILSQTKLPALSAAEKIKQVFPEFSFVSFQLQQLSEFDNLLTDHEQIVMQGMLKNRDICIDARAQMESEKLDHKKFGQLLTEHHQYLRDNLNISTPKIEKILQASLNAGAFGGKINGSGGGGCMFAYAPDDPQKVADAIEKVGGKAYIVNVGEGLEVNMK